MYGIKRNVKVRNLNNNNSVVKSSPRILKNNGLGKYKYPKCDEVPAGKYFSKITAIREKTSWAGYPGIEVFYELIDGELCYKIATGMLPEDAEKNPYYVIQFYQENTLYYDAFIDAMSEALGVKSFPIGKVVGVTEWITLSYGKSDIGGFSSRTPCEWEELMEMMKEYYEEQCS